jgi:transposase-like protein
MTTKNPYRKNSHLSRQKTVWILRYFAKDLTATQTSNLLWIERKTINNRYDYLRKVILRYCENEERELFKWEIELDESYFWATRVRGKRWRWAGMKSIVFWLRKRNWKVYAEIVPDCSSATLRKIIRGKIDQNSIIHTDWRRWYNGLVDVWYNKHYRVDHWKNEFARGKKHINWIESFWSYCKRRLWKFNWVIKRKFSLHLKECEFRFNCWIEWEDIYNKLSEILKEYVKFFAKVL